MKAIVFFRAFMTMMVIVMFGTYSTMAQSMTGSELYRKGLDYFFGGENIPKDYAKAVEYFRLAEEKNCYYGDLYYGFCLMVGKGVEKNEVEGAKRYARAASTGDRQAMYYFGNALEVGSGVARNADAAKRYFGESAKKGETQAINKLRDAYGITDYTDLNIDWHNSERFLNVKVNDNVVQSLSGAELYNKGLDYFIGRENIPKDYAKAAEFFRQAEQKNCYNGDLYYGFCLMVGKGVKKNEVEGAKRYARAASTGDRQAMYYFGNALEVGSGVARNADAAKRYFAESAKKGESRAINKLRDEYGITEFSELTIDWHNSERFLNGNVNNNNNNIKKSDTEPSFTWLTYQDNVNNPNYTFKVGVKSASAIQSYSIFVNGTLARGIKTVTNDGYDYVFNPTVKLNHGTNVVMVKVETANGSYASQRNVTYNSIDNKTVFADKRIALVLGNSAYADPSHRLPNPVNDANDVAAKLSKLGFKVIKLTDQGQSAIEKVVADFAHEAVGYDVAMFFYAGHGISSKGSNYIIPTDAVLPSEDAVRYKCVDVNMILDMMESAGCKMKILVLDACRNNPFARSWYRSAGKSGLSTMSAPKGTFISFSTAPGDVAADGVDGERNSPFTSVFLNTLDKPGLSINDFFQDVLEQVAIKTNERQTPWTSSSFRGNFIFNNQ